MIYSLQSISKYIVLFNSCQKNKTKQKPNARSALYPHFMNEEIESLGVSILS